MTPQEAGEHFHRQLHALLPEQPQHPDHLEHDEAVGKALLRALDQGEVHEAIAEYNAWAEANQYAPVRYVAGVQDEHVLDISNAIVRLRGDHTVTVAVPYG